MTEAEVQAGIKEIEDVIKNGWGTVLIKIAEHEIQFITPAPEKKMDKLVKT
jgi:hypothetical protein